MHTDKNGWAERSRQVQDRTGQDRRESEREREKEKCKQEFENFNYACNENYENPQKSFFLIDFFFSFSFSFAFVAGLKRKRRPTMRGGDGCGMDG